MKNVLQSLKCRSAWYEKAIRMAKREIPWENGFNWPFSSGAISPFDHRNIPYWEGAKKELENSVAMIECEIMRL